MKVIPFSFYDFFGYLAPGFLTLAVFDLAFLNQKLYNSDKSQVAFWVFLVGGAYLIGQVLAFFSYHFYERFIVGKWLQKPATNLLLNRNAGLAEKLFRQYFDSLPKQIREKILKKAIGENLEISALHYASLSDNKYKNGDLTKDLIRDLKALYLHSYSLVKMNELAMAQQDTFLKLYGFARNISLTSLFVIPFIIYQCIRAFSQSWHWLVIFSVAGVAMFYVYLKFYRWHTRELFLAYSELQAHVPARDSVKKSRKSIESPEMEKKEKA